LEGSKAFSKDFMARHSIPTARHRTFRSTEFEEAIKYVRECDHPVVLKASGLAGGKGVLIPKDVEETIEGLRDIMVNSIFGSAGVSELAWLS
jgi:phosphoribosylamine--glycine ligase/phosphoribosylformylglycinamidine cyclo-ligase